MFYTKRNSFEYPSILCFYEEHYYNGIDSRPNIVFYKNIYV